ncbi:hypothetical protein Q3G72_034059 [Acer saccharum]|nr:hypothetical protein Q3G72_034059 [Acer saccharum]
MASWPLFADQFYKEKLVTQVLKIGVGVGVQEMRNMGVSVEREAIEKALKEIMVGDGAEEMKKRAKGKHLAEHYRNVTYPKVPNFVLWVLAEISIVACGIPEGNGATGLAISFLGAMVMPHNPFLQSAFGAFQEDPETHSRHQVCYSTNTTPEDQGSCKDLDLNRAKSM